MTDQILKCPVCEGNLMEAVTRNGRELWCPSIKCTSLAADVGGVGRTTQEAFDALTKAVEAERQADLKDMQRARP